MLRSADTGSRPFVKWAGGKSGLLPLIDARLPQSVRRGEPFTYLEPFVGGGAMLFYLLDSYPNLRRAVINDKNEHLITTYRVVQRSPKDLVGHLAQFDKEYNAMPAGSEARKSLFLEIRRRFNEDELNDAERAACFIFLNRTCFNGLYRVNSRGLYNVPHGRYVHPRICDAETIMADSERLQKVEIKCGDFAETLPLAGPRTFVYLDPPYRPLSVSSSFTAYDKDGFTDADQLRLKHYCDACEARGASVLQSNSDSRDEAGAPFFDALYCAYAIDRVQAARAINCSGTGRGPVSELLIRNYNH